MLRWHVVSAVFSRNFKQYFTSVLGYLFIFVFVTVCAALTFSQQFFADNLANLDQLSKYYPFLLLFFIPAVTMGIWADEKKQGTDAILFTLPASDLEILLGKFLSVVAVYSVALLFSGTQLIALARLGNPDWGVIATTYLGYWLAGVALLSIGMFASALTRSTTVAFVIGALLCAIPVLFGSLMEGNRFFESYGVSGQLRDFTLGLVSLPGVVYFLSITIFMLYLNVVVISKRHWSRGRQVTLSGHFAFRIIALGLALFSANVLAESSSAAFNNRADLTSEALFSLNQTTRDAIAEAARNERPVEIQAFLSPNMPRQYVNTRKNLVGLLRQYDRLGGNLVNVRFVDVAPNSPQVKEAGAQEIKPRASREDVGGRIIEQDVYMGLVMSSSLDRVVLPFVDTDSSIEYQLTRSLATVTNPKRRLKIGILKNDLHFDNIQYQGRHYPWLASRTMQDLESQYEVVTINPEDLPTWNPPPKEENTAGDDAETGETATDDASENQEDERRLDVLIVASPSTLDMLGLFQLNEYIQAGNPTLLLMDPLPFYNRFTWQLPRRFGVINAPVQPRMDSRAGWGVILPTDQDKAFGGTISPLLEALGIQWAHDRTVWNLFNPHVGFKPTIASELGERWPEEYGPKQNLFVFAKSHADHVAFNQEHSISSGLQELLFMYPGSLAPRPPASDADGTPVESKTEFQPLVMLKSGFAGHLNWDELTEDLISEQLQINQFTGETALVTGPETNSATGHTTRNIR
ncbi:MAG: DUF7088 domain-containing protein, partial [Pirellulaceae bacterium]